MPHVAMGGRVLRLRWHVGVIAMTTTLSEPEQAIRINPKQVQQTGETCLTASLHHFLATEQPCMGVCILIAFQCKLKRQLGRGFDKQQREPNKNKHERLAWLLGPDLILADLAQVLAAQQGSQGKVVGPSHGHCLG